LADEAEDVFLIVVAVGVIGDAGALVGGDLILVNHPFQRGAVAQAVIVGWMVRFLARFASLVSLVALRLRLRVGRRRKEGHNLSVSAAGINACSTRNAVKIPQNDGRFCLTQRRTNGRVNY
jgi:hypothetical protein